MKDPFVTQSAGHQNFSSPFLKKAVRHGVGLAGIAGLLLFYFFVVTRYPSFPWWHELQGNDIDGTHAATTIALLNQGDITLLHHPALTIGHLHGMVYRLLAFFDPAHARLLALDQVESMYAALALIETATRTSRYLVLLSVLFFLGIFYAFLYRMTRHSGISLMASAYAFWSIGILRHVTMIRPEILSLMFFYGAAYVYEGSARQHREWRWPAMLSWIGVGFLMGFAVLSKIQIGPAVVLLFGLILVRAVRQGHTYGVSASSHGQALSMRGPQDGGWRWALLNVVLFPWWAMRRPDFLTSAFMERLGAHAYQWTLYGEAPPASFIVLPLVLLLGLLGMAGLARWLPCLRGRVASMLNVFHGVLTGGILAIYVALAPVSMSMGQYIRNTRHAMYALLTSITGAGALHHKVLDGDVWGKIFGHLQQGNVLKMNLAWIVLAAVIYVLWGVMRRRDWRLIYILSWFVLALSMDCLATMRSQSLFAHYFVYSVCFYATGLALVAAELWPRLQRQQGGRGATRWALVGVCVLHLGYRVMDVVRQPRLSGKGSRYPLWEFRQLDHFAQPFLKIVHPRLYPKIATDQFQAGRYGEAAIWDSVLEELDEAVAARPDEIQAYLARAQVYTTRQQWELAMADYAQVLAIQPDHAQAYRGRGDVLRHRGKPLQAIEQYTRALAHAPFNYNSHNHRGNAYKIVGDWDAATQDYTAAIQINPTQWTAYFNRGLVAQAREDWAAAAQDFDAVIRISPENMRVYFQRAQARQRLGRLKEALADYDQVIALDQDQTYRALAHWQQAKIYQRRGQDRLARQHLALAHHTRAQAYIRQGNQSLAAADFQAALKYWPNIEKALKDINSKERK